MKKLIVFVAILALAVAACSPQEGVELGRLAAPQDPVSSQPGSEEAPGSQSSSSDSVAIQEATNGPLTARIFSAQETTINQQEFVLQGWTNRAGVVSANETIITNAANETFSIKLSMEDGPNLVEVIISDHNGNEVRFELIVFVD